MEQIHIYREGLRLGGLWFILLDMGDLRRFCYWGYDLRVGDSTLCELLWYVLSYIYGASLPVALVYYHRYTCGFPGVIAFILHFTPQIA